MQLQRPFDAHKDSKRRNFLNYNYVFNRLFQKLNCPQFCVFFPTIKSQAKLQALDATYLKMARCINWPETPLQSVAPFAVQLTEPGPSLARLRASNPQLDQNVRQKSVMKKNFGGDPWATTWSTTKSSVVFHDLHPLPRFSFFRGFWKESPESSKTSETTLEFCTRVPKQRAPNLHTCKTCQTCQLRKTCKTCVAGLHTVCNRLQQCRYKGGVGAANAAPRVRTSSYIYSISHIPHGDMRNSARDRVSIAQCPYKSRSSPGVPRACGEGAPSHAHACALSHGTQPHARARETGENMRKNRWFEDACAAQGRGGVTLAGRDPCQIGAGTAAARDG